MCVAKKENFVVYSDNINMSLQSLIWESSGYEYDLCKFVAKNQRNLRNHKLINHTFEGDNWNGVWHPSSICKSNVNLKD